MCIDFKDSAILFSASSRSLPETSGFMYMYACISWVIQEHTCSAPSPDCSLFPVNPMRRHLPRMHNREQAITRIATASWSIITERHGLLTLWARQLFTQTARYDTSLRTCDPKDVGFRKTSVSVPWIWRSCAEDDIRAQQCISSLALLTLYGVCPRRCASSWGQHRDSCMLCACCCPPCSTAVCAKAAFQTDRASEALVARCF